MTEYDLKDLLAKNIKKYRKGIFTQETLAEKIGVSCQNINDIEGKRRFPRAESLVKIADALNVEVYQLFAPENAPIAAPEETLEVRRICDEVKRRIISDCRKSLNKVLDKIENSPFE